MKTTPKQKEEIFKKSLAGKSIEDLSKEYGIPKTSIKTIVYEQKRMAAKDEVVEQSMRASVTQFREPAAETCGRKTMTCKQEIRLWKLMYADLAMKLWGRDFPDLENL